MRLASHSPSAAKLNLYDERMGSDYPRDNFDQLRNFMTTNPQVIASLNHLRFEDGAAVYDVGDGQGGGEVDQREKGLRTVALRLDGTMFRNHYQDSSNEPFKNLYFDHNELPSYQTRIDSGVERPDMIFRPSFFNYPIGKDGRPTANSKPYVLINGYKNPARKADGSFDLSVPTDSTLSLGGTTLKVRGSNGNRNTPFSSIFSADDIMRNNGFGSRMHSSIDDEANDAFGYGLQHTSENVIVARQLSPSGSSPVVPVQQAAGTSRVATYDDFTSSHTEEGKFGVMDEAIKHKKAFDAIPQSRSDLGETTPENTITGLDGKAYQGYTLDPQNFNAQRIQDYKDSGADGGYTYLAIPIPLFVQMVQAGNTKVLIDTIPPNKYAYTANGSDNWYGVRPIPAEGDRISVEADNFIPHIRDLLAAANGKVRVVINIYNESNRPENYKSWFGKDPHDADWQEHYNNIGEIAKKIHQAFGNQVIVTTNFADTSSYKDDEGNNLFIDQLVMASKQPYIDALLINSYAHNTDLKDITLPQVFAKAGVTKPVAISEAGTSSMNGEPHQRTTDIGDLKNAHDMHMSITLMTLMDNSRKAMNFANGFAHPSWRDLLSEAWPTALLIVKVFMAFLVYFLALRFAVPLIWFISQLFKGGVDANKVSEHILTGMGLPKGWAHVWVELRHRDGGYKGRWDALKRMNKEAWKMTVKGISFRTFLGTRWFRGISIPRIPFFVFMARVVLTIIFMMLFKYGLRGDDAFKKTDRDSMANANANIELMIAWRNIVGLNQRQMVAFENMLRMFEKLNIGLEDLKAIINSDHVESLVGRYSKQRAAEVILKLMYEKAVSSPDFEDLVDQRFDAVAAAYGLATAPEFANVLNTLKDTFKRNIARLLPEGLQLSDYDVPSDLMIFSWDDLRERPDSELLVRGQLISIEKLVVFQTIFQRGLFSMTGQGTPEQWLWGKYVYTSLRGRDAAAQAKVVDQLRAWRQVFHALMNSEVSERLGNNRDPQGDTKYFQFVINEEVANDAFRYLMGGKDPMLNDASWVLSPEIRRRVAGLRNHFESMLLSVTAHIAAMPQGTETEKQAKRDAITNAADEIKPIMLAWVAVVDSEIGMPVVKNRLGSMWKLTALPVLKLMLPTNWKMARRIFSRGGPYNQGAFDMLRRVHNYSVLAGVTALFGYFSWNLTTVLPVITMPSYFAIPWAFAITFIIFNIYLFFVSPLMKLMFLNQRNKALKQSTNAARKQEIFTSFDRKLNVLRISFAVVFIASLVVVPVLFTLPNYVIPAIGLTKYGIHIPVLVQNLFKYVFPMLIFIDTWRLTFYAVNYLFMAVAGRAEYTYNNLYEVRTKGVGNIVRHLSVMFMDNTASLGTRYNTRGQERLTSFIEALIDMMSPERGRLYLKNESANGGMLAGMTDADKEQGVLWDIARDLQGDKKARKDARKRLEIELWSILDQVTTAVEVENIAGKKFGEHLKNNFVVRGWRRLIDGKSSLGLLALTVFINHNYRFDKGADAFSLNHALPITTMIPGHDEDWYFTNKELLGFGTENEVEEFTHRLGMLAKYKTEAFLYMVERLTAPKSVQRDELLKMINNPTHVPTVPAHITQWANWLDIREWANLNLPTAYANSLTQSRVLKSKYENYAHIFGLDQQQAKAFGHHSVRIVDRVLGATHELNKILGGRLREVVDTLVRTDYDPVANAVLINDLYRAVLTAPSDDKYDQVTFTKMLDLIICERVLPIYLYSSNRRKGTIGEDPLLNENYHRAKWNQKTALLPFIVGPVLLNLDTDHRTSYIDTEFINNHLLEYHYLPGLAVSTPVIRHDINKGLGRFGNILPVSENAFYYHAQLGKHLFGGVTAYGKLFERVSALRHSEGITDSYVAEDSLTAMNYRRFGYITGRAGYVKFEKGWMFSFWASTDPTRKWSYDSVESVTGRISMKILMSPLVDWPFLVNNYWLDGFGFYFKKPGIVRYIRWLVPFYLVLGWNLFSGVAMVFWVGSLILSQAISHGLFFYKSLDEARGDIRGTIAGIGHVIGYMVIYFLHMVFVNEETVGAIGINRLGRFKPTGGKGNNQSRVHNKTILYMRSAPAIKSGASMALVILLFAGLSGSVVMLWLPTIIMGFMAVAAPAWLNPVRKPWRGDVRENIWDGFRFFGWAVIDNFENFVYAASIPWARRIEDRIQTDILRNADIRLSFPAAMSEFRNYLDLFHQIPGHYRQMYGQPVRPVISALHNGIFDLNLAAEIRRMTWNFEKTEFDPAVLAELIREKVLVRDSTDNTKVYLNSNLDQKEPLVRAVAGTDFAQVWALLNRANDVFRALMAANLVVVNPDNGSFELAPGFDSSRENDVKTIVANVGGSQEEANHVWYALMLKLNGHNIKIKSDHTWQEYQLEKYQGALKERIKELDAFLDALAIADAQLVARVRARQLAQVNDTVTSAKPSFRQLDRADWLITQMSWLPREMDHPLTRSKILSWITNKTIGQIGVDALIQAVFMYIVLPFILFWHFFFTFNQFNKDHRAALSGPASFNPAEIAVSHLLVTVPDLPVVVAQLAQTDGPQENKWVNAAKVILEAFRRWLIAIVLVAAIFHGAMKTQLGTKFVTQAQGKIYVSQAQIKAVAPNLGPNTMLDRNGKPVHGFTVNPQQFSNYDVPNIASSHATVIHFTGPVVNNTVNAIVKHTDVRTMVMDLPAQGYLNYARSVIVAVDGKAGLIFNVANPTAANQVAHDIHTQISRQVAVSTVAAEIPQNLTEALKTEVDVVIDSNHGPIALIADDIHQAENDAHVQKPFLLETGVSSNFSEDSQAQGDVKEWNNARAMGISILCPYQDIAPKTDGFFKADGTPKKAFFEMQHRWAPLSGNPATNMPLPVGGFLLTAFGKGRKKSSKDRDDQEEDGAFTGQLNKRESQKIVDQAKADLRVTAIKDVLIKEIARQVWNVMKFKADYYTQPRCMRIATDKITFGAFYSSKDRAIYFEDPFLSLLSKNDVANLRRIQGLEDRTFAKTETGLFIQVISHELYNGTHKENIQAENLAITIRRVIPRMFDQQACDRISQAITHPKSVFKQEGVPVILFSHPTEKQIEYVMVIRMNRGRTIERNLRRLLGQHGAHKDRIVLSSMPGRFDNNVPHALTSLLERVGQKEGIQVITEKEFYETKERPSMTTFPTLAGREDALIHADARYTGPSLEGKVVLMIDDITTSGTSLKVAADILKSAGAAEVISIAMIKAPMEYPMWEMVQVKRIIRKRFLHNLDKVLWSGATGSLRSIVEDIRMEEDFIGRLKTKIVSLEELEAIARVMTEGQDFTWSQGYHSIGLIQFISDLRRIHRDTEESLLHHVEAKPIRTDFTEFPGDILRSMVDSLKQTAQVPFIAEVIHQVKEIVDSKVNTATDNYERLRWTLQAVTVVENAIRFLLATTAQRLNITIPNEQLIIQPVIEDVLFEAIVRLSEVQTHLSESYIRFATRANPTLEMFRTFEKASDDYETALQRVANAILLAESGAQTPKIREAIRMTKRDLRVIDHSGIRIPKPAHATGRTLGQSSGMMQSAREQYQNNENRDERLGIAVREARAEEVAYDKGLISLEGLIRGHRYNPNIESVIELRLFIDQVSRNVDDKILLHMWNNYLWHVSQYSQKTEFEERFGAYLMSLMDDHLKKIIFETVHILGEEPLMMGPTGDDQPALQLVVADGQTDDNAADASQNSDDQKPAGPKDPKEPKDDKDHRKPMAIAALALLFAMLGLLRYLSNHKGAVKTNKPVVQPPVKQQGVDVFVPQPHDQQSQDAKSSHAGFGKHRIRIPRIYRVRAFNLKYAPRIFRWNYRNVGRATIDLYQILFSFNVTGPWILWLVNIVNVGTLWTIQGGWVWFLAWNSGYLWEENSCSWSFLDWQLKRCAIPVAVIMIVITVVRIILKVTPRFITFYVVDLLQGLSRVFHAMTMMVYDISVEFMSSTYSYVATL